MRHALRLARILVGIITLWSGSSVCVHQTPCRAEEASDKSQAVAQVTAFLQEVLPLLERHCYECHSHAAGQASGGLMLDSREGWAQGGDSGPAIVPGQVDESLMVRAIRYQDLEMPPKGRLPETDRARLERWVAEGAFDPRVASAPSATQKTSDDARRHWAFQPMQSPAVPATANTSWPRRSLDRFLLTRLEAEQLQPASDAEPRIWLRRISLDLTGLPPTLGEQEAFLADIRRSASGGADAGLAVLETPYRRVVDRLLASSAFGERWARHWLDLVGYADQIGTANDIFAEHAWRYRDYVIDAFNADLPFDQFVREQIAGDLLGAELAGDRARQLTATGFLLLGDLSIVEADKAKLRIDTADAQLEKVSRAFLGMTIGCARCHDHKFDPITQRDYYAMAGIFYNTASIRRASWGVWSWPSTRELPETEHERQERERRTSSHLRKLEELRAERDRLETRRAELDRELEQAVADSTPDEKLKKEEERKQVSDRLGTLLGQITHAEFFVPKNPIAFSAEDEPTSVDMHVTIRGNPHALGDLVPRGFWHLPQMTMAGPSSADWRFDEKSSGRRELAEWLVRDVQSLTARVVVNRIWQKLFGEGIVRSVDYFGVRGDLPSHPELLDHLAAELIRNHWSQKWLIRELVLSRAYRMSSEHRPDAHQRDPDNKWLWRMHRKRLDAESLRDASLAVSGKLLRIGRGPSLPLEFLENTGGLAKGDVNPPSFRLRRFRPEQTYVRTVYLPIVRSQPQSGPAEIRNVFDFTQPAAFAGQRAVTTVPTQALFLLNSKSIKERSGELSATIQCNNGDDASRIRELWMRVLNRPPSDEEQEDARRFLAEWRNDRTDTSSDVDQEQRAWSELSHVLLASNEFLIRQ